RWEQRLKIANYFAIVKQKTLDPGFRRGDVYRVFRPDVGIPILFHHPARTRKDRAMAHVEHKNFSSPDETRTFGHGKAELIQIGGGTIGRLTLEPGWRWSQDVKPLAGTAWCEAPHFQYQVSGRLHVVMEDGT